MSLGLQFWGFFYKTVHLGNREYIALFYSHCFHSATYHVHYHAGLVVLLDFYILCH